MTASTTIDEVFAALNPQQRAAACHGQGPLLIVAGAGTGKTTTLVHRVAWLLHQGISPERVLLLTFTRRAADEMLRRVATVTARLRTAQLAAGQSHTSSRIWGGTFHAVATRLLRRFGKLIDLPPAFNILDRGDSEDLMGAVRTDLGLAKTDKRFPQKGTCADIYSRCVNARQPLDEVLPSVFPWCKEWESELKKLFKAYVDRKESSAVLDYDDLLLYWQAMMAHDETAARIRRLFDCVLVDEYQDTNVLQAEILYGLCPGGNGLTVVGDDAQSIYSFRAATVRNILDLPKQYPATTIVALEQNYRSTEPILAATNRVIALAKERFTKNLWSSRAEGERPVLACCHDEDDQVAFVIGRVLEYRESGVALRRQAVLFRASHHSMLLEAELTRRNIPFRKYGGLKFVETAHVKDLLAFLRLAENPRDVVAGGRILPLLPGIGPVKARQLLASLSEAGGAFDPWRAWKPPPASAAIWPKLVELLEGLAGSKEELSAQVHRVRLFYKPLLEQRYDNPAPRQRDLEQLEQIASRWRSRRRMLLEMALDPPDTTQELPADPHLDDDYLVLSTIHSAKGLEWDAVYVIHAADGNIPSDMATGSPEEIEEELRLFYVALTRAKNRLFVSYPLRYHFSYRRQSDAHGFAQRTRFLPPAVMAAFDPWTDEATDDDTEEDGQSWLDSARIRGHLKRLWD